MTNDDRAEFFGMVVRLAAVTRADCDEPTQHLYFRAMRDVPMDLVRRASVELAKNTRFMPTPAEWRQMVDVVIEQRQTRGPQAALPGLVEQFRCERCGNTGWVELEKICEKGAACGPLKETQHTHTFAARCTDEGCVRHRAARAERKRRYGKRED